MFFTTPFDVLKCYHNVIDLYRYVYSQSSSNLHSDEPESNWLATGKFGTSHSVLRFSLAALKNTHLWQTPPDTPAITTTPTKASKPLCGSGSSPKALEPKNGFSFANRSSSRNAPTKSSLFPDKILHKKRAHESLSSSDTSIASSLEEADGDLDEPPPQATKSGNVKSIKPVGSAPGKENRESSIATCSEICEMPAMRLKINYRFANTETRLLRRILNCHGLQEVDETKDFHLLWTGGHAKTDILRYLKPYQRMNHFPRLYFQNAFKCACSFTFLLLLTDHRN